MGEKKELKVTNIELLYHRVAQSKGGERINGKESDHNNPQECVRARAYMCVCVCVCV